MLVRSRRCFLLILALVTTVAIPSVVAQSSGSSALSIPVSVTVNGESAQQLSVTLTGTGRLVGVDAEGLAKELSGLATASVLRAIHAAGGSAGMAPLAALEAIGLKIQFDTQTLELRVDLPKALQKVHHLELGSAAPPPSAVAVQPARFSAQLSVRGRLDLLDEYTAAGQGVPATNTLSLPLSVTLGPAVNLATWVLESEIGIATESRPAVTLSNLRLVKDFTHSATRLTAGTLTSAAPGLASSLSMVGVGFSRNFDLLPTRLYRPLGQMNFYLNQPSEVQVMVNGVPIQYLQLPAGPYNISNFPLSPGTNHVTIDVKDAKGNVEHLSAQFPFDSQLLRPGTSSLAIDAGLPGWTIAPPVVSGFYRRGILRSLTAGAYAQADLQNQLLGAQGLYASPYGTIETTVAGSHDATHGFSYSAYGTYRYSALNRPGLPSISLAAQYAGQYFLAPEHLASEAPYKWSLRASASQALPGNLSLSIGVGYRVPWGGAPSLNASTILNIPLKGGYMTAFVLASHPSGSPWSWSGSLTFTTLIGGSATTVTGTQDLTHPSMQVNVSGSPAAVPGLMVNGSLTGPLGISGEMTGGSVDVSYQGNRLNLGGGESLSLNRAASSNSWNDHTYLSFGSALVYADGLAGITRPVSDSFAIFRRQHDLSKLFVGINPGTEGYEASSDRLGNPILPDILSYSPKLATIEVPNLPLGADIGNHLFLFDLPYRSGAVVPIGSTARVYISGNLVDSSDKAITLVGGELTRAGKTEKVIPFFTDRRGRFEAYGLEPGSYRLTLLSGSWKPATITIPPKASGRYDVGSIVLSSTAKGKQ